MALLGGTTVEWLWQRARTTPALAVATIVAILAPLPMLVPDARYARVRDPNPNTLAANVRATVPKDACIVSFEPSLLLAAGRIPQVGDGHRFAVDTYGAVLIEQMRRSNANYSDVNEAFKAQPLETSPMRALERCQLRHHQPASLATS